MLASWPPLPKLLCLEILFCWVVHFQNFCLQLVSRQSSELVVSTICPPVAPMMDFKIMKKIMRKQTVDPGMLVKEYVPLNWTKLGKNSEGRRISFVGKILLDGC